MNVEYEFERIVLHERSLRRQRKSRRMLWFNRTNVTVCAVFVLLHVWQQRWVPAVAQLGIGALAVWTAHLSKITIRNEIELRQRFDA